MLYFTMYDIISKKYNVLKGYLMENKKIKLYNLIFPIWFLLLIPISWIIVLPANFVIDFTVVALTMKFMKVTEIKKKTQSVIAKVWIFGFIADFIGAGAMYMVDLITFDNNSLLQKWWDNNMVYGVNYSPFENIYSILWVTLCVLITAVLIYIFNYKLCLKKLAIDDLEKKKLAFSLAVFTAPYLFYLPTNWLVN